MPYIPYDYLADGLGAAVGLSLPGTRFYAETEITPPLPKGRGAIDLVSLRNQVVATKGPKAIYEYQTLTFRAAIDPEFAADLEATSLIVNQEMGFMFPNGAGFTIWGWIESLSEGGMTEGNRPLFLVTCELSNINDTTGEEEPATWYPDISAHFLFSDL